MLVRCWELDGWLQGSDLFMILFILLNSMRLFFSISVFCSYCFCCAFRLGR